ncbi:HAMP domain-containing sensor histidine kinase [Sporosarcina sp. 179-K 3D1 HS]|uniref:HAMP domain-containing sensor histidine kinase n=1 Tax=Sporosarcina sp. 179-K 3D1 HS TaxID=3232169 RepID=UPI0039A31051
MRIRTWLLASYLIVMLLPLGAAYGLFAWINSYHEERNVAEYMDNLVKLNEIQGVLAEPSLYQPNTDWSEVDKLANSRIAITLYTDIGFMVHSTSPVRQSPLAFMPRKELYEGFYELRQKFGLVTYKEPVFVGNSLIGVYEITWIRDEWVAGVSKRTWLVGVLFAVFFLSLFAGVAFLVNRKLNRPLQLLMGQMDSFGKGEPTQPIPKRKDELGELAESFEAMRTELISANQKLTAEQKQKEFMIASISHDLKTPLTSIRAYAEALDDRALSTRKQREYRNVIISKANYMRQMLDDLLMYTLLQSSAYEMALVPVDGEEFFDMLVSGYETLCDEKQIDLRVTCVVTGTYAVNSKQLMRVADNLMMNAIAHTEARGIIGLTAVNVAEAPNRCSDFVKEALDAEDGMYLIVQNEGEGIREDQLANVFEPLYQADEARTKAGERGTGLGLSITKQIIEKHGGTVRIVSHHGIGTAIICWLPHWKGATKNELDQTTIRD